MPCSESIDATLRVRVEQDVQLVDDGDHVVGRQDFVEVGGLAPAPFDGSGVGVVDADDAAGQIGPVARCA